MDSVSTLFYISLLFHERDWHEKLSIRLILFQGSIGDYIGKPIIETFWRSIYGCMRTVDTDSLLGKTEQRTLLGVG